MTPEPPAGAIDAPTAATSPPTDGQVSRRRDRPSRCRSCRSRTPSFSRRFFCRWRSAGQIRSRPSMPPSRAKKRRWSSSPSGRTPMSRRCRTDLFTVGTRAVIKRLNRGDDAVEVLVQGMERVRLTAFDQVDPYLRARVEIVPLPDDHGPEVEALQRAVLELAAQAIELAQPQPGRDQRPANVGCHARPAAAGVSARVDARVGRGQRTGVARGPDPARRAAAGSRLSRP